MDFLQFLLLAGASVEGSKSTGALKGLTASTITGAAEGVTTPRHFSLADVNKLSLKNLNGRVIKQTVRTAQALAVSAGEELSLSHVSLPLIRLHWRILQFVLTLRSGRDCLTDLRSVRGGLEGARVRRPPGTRVGAEDDVCLKCTCSKRLDQIRVPK